MGGGHGKDFGLIGTIVTLANIFITLPTLILSFVVLSRLERIKGLLSHPPAPVATAREAISNLLDSEEFLRRIVASARDAVRREFDEQRARSTPAHRPRSPGPMTTPPAWAPEPALRAAEGGPEDRRAQAELLAALGQVLRESQAPGGRDVVEFDLTRLLSLAQTSISVRDCQEALRRINLGLPEQSDPVLIAGDFLQMRSLRSESGAPNIRVQVKAEAALPLMTVASAPRTETT